MNYSIHCIFVLFATLLYSNECPKNYIQINENCYFKKHVDVLQDFIDYNEKLFNIDPNNIGIQEWLNGKLTYLNLSNYEIEIIPDSIGTLNNLINLELENNNITFLPESICELYPYHTQINLKNNKLCPPYPYCFEYIGKQDIALCENKRIASSLALNINLSEFIITCFPRYMSGASGL